ADRLRLALDVERRQALSRGDQGAGQLVVTIHHRQRLGWPHGVAHAVKEVPASIESSGGHALGKLDVGQLQSDARLVVEAERVEWTAQHATTFADNTFQTLVELIPEDRVRRQFPRLSRVEPADDRAGARPQGT